MPPTTTLQNVCRSYSDVLKLWSIKKYGKSCVNKRYGHKKWFRLDSHLNRMMRFPSAAFSKIFTKPSEDIVPRIVTTTTDINMTMTRRKNQFFSNFIKDVCFRIKSVSPCHASVDTTACKIQKMTKHIKKLFKYPFELCHKSPCLFYFNTTNKCVKYTNCTNNARD